MVTLIDATIALATEITVLGLLVVAFILKNKKRYFQHGTIMTFSVAIHVVTILSVMLPSLSIYFTSPGAKVIDAIVIVSFIHVGFGFIAVAIGSWLVASWHFRKDLRKCFANKKLMKPTLTLWIIAILIGITMYIVFWASLLFLS